MDCYFIQFRSHFQSNILTMRIFFQTWCFSSCLAHGGSSANGMERPRATPNYHCPPQSIAENRETKPIMLTHYLSIAIRNFRSAPFAFAMNVLTLALGIACFVIAYAFVVFWGGAEKHFANADRIAVLTTSMTLKDNSFSFDGVPEVPLFAAKYLKEDFPAIEKIARAKLIGDKTMVA